MKKLKIKPINNIIKVKEAFDFFKDSFLHMTQTEASVFLPMHEIYQTMVDNLESKTKIQFYAELDEKIIGCVIGNIKREEMFLPVIAVDYRLRDSGIAAQLLYAVSLYAKKYKVKKLTVRSSVSSSGFFKRNGFNCYLYITAYPPQTTKDIKDANKDDLPIMAEDENQQMVKFLTPKIDNKYILPFKRKLKNLDFDFMMEKRI